MHAVVFSSNVFITQRALTRTAAFSTRIYMRSVLPACTHRGPRFIIIVHPDITALVDWAQNTKLLTYLDLVTSDYTHGHAYNYICISPQFKEDQRGPLAFVTPLLSGRPMVGYMFGFVSLKLLNTSDRPTYMQLIFVMLTFLDQTICGQCKPLCDFRHVQGSRSSRSFEDGCGSLQNARSSLSP